MTWLLVVLILLVIGGVAVVATGAGDPLAPAYDDRPDVPLPTDRPLTAEDLMEVRFTSVVRGYRASEVDALIARLAQQLYGQRAAGNAAPAQGPVHDPAQDPAQDPARTDEPPA
ncbi:DivIVA domain-containing protein [Nocardioides marmoriginsengisoli]|uniref:DivIVA domain-containing protein n=1 Tax=Nocardioides marmoriginsengisoli TaxID=661483 RepID=A0A3N0CH84_9ACTN|nr:DivIVA domain-containing protein [Nocardioides marmoriginsengisoli]RNL62631.1 DivIVA domain-containing protein [Nocardioides marmoriginsengisoli]